MPRAVKLFLVLCFVYAAWLVWWNVGPLLFPSPQRLQTLAQLPADIRAMVDQGEWVTAGIRILIPLVLYGTLALTAALARRNWARWGLALLLVAGEFSLFILIAYYSVAHADIRLPQELTWTGGWHDWLHRWAYWQTGVRVALKLALIATIFVPAAKPWFRRDPIQT
jgi:hypothetical protein